MKETSGGSDGSRAARARRAATDATTVADPDDSFAEERFISPPTIPAGSWESLDDSEERPKSRPSSRTSVRDQRKQFDTTTPTLIDEEYEQEAEEEEIASLEQTRQYIFSSKEEEMMRRTPGAASLFKSSDEITAAAMRRTPGASAMHRSALAAAADTQQDLDEEEAVGLGFALTLSTPVGNDEKVKAKGKIWESFSPHSASASPIMTTRPGERDAPSRPPLAPAPPGTSRSATAQGPFSFQPWARSPTSELQGDRHGAFSPNILRLTEDIGNLLHEDEDDDYALEIPSVFRGDGDDLAEFGQDWMGSYIFDHDHQRVKPSVPRPSAFAKEGKPRRRSNSSQGNPVAMHAQHPKPRRLGNELFEFGKGREEKLSPQLLNFGGAFAPPPQAQTGSFMRPVAEGSTTEFGHHAMPFRGTSHLHDDVGAPEIGGASFGMPSHSYDARESMLTSEANQTQSFYTTQLNQPASAAQISSAQFSEMQATAREFVPKGVQSPPPQALPAHSSQMPSPAFMTTGVHHPWPPQSLQPSYDPSVGATHWYAPSTTNFDTHSTYPMQRATFGDVRTTMTPSPVMQMWQHPGNATVYASQPGVDQHAISEQGVNVEGVQPYREQQRTKKETKRGKRGKKKPKAEKSVVGNRKIGRIDGLRPDSAVSQEGTAEDTCASAAEDPIDAKRAELVESPSTRIAFKDFYRSFRGEEKNSFYKAEEFALHSLTNGSLPESVHWRVYLELADLAKRSNRFVEARRLYQKVCQLQPYASQGWLEYSKLEEECGHMNRVTNILHAGLEYCEYNENLLTRAVKHQEKMGNLTNARELLARLKHVGIDKVWKTVLEGALLEGRAGNDTMARRVLKYLMHHVPWYGPLYLEAYKLERDLGHPLDALHIVERGLHAIPRYGPLWFGAFRICEEMDIAKSHYELPNAMSMIERATHSISKELVWKVHLEAGQMLERAVLEKSGDNQSSLDVFLNQARQRFALTILTCPHNLRWKVWLAAARLELGIGKFDRARALFTRAHKAVPEKGRSSTLLECVRLEEFVGDADLARAILCKARFDYGSDWKVWLESVLLEIRNHQLMRSFELCSQALDLHPGTGRLWAALIQLSQVLGGNRAQHITLKRALNAVPKSGEVWCEGARIYLNPFSDTFDVDRARRHLTFATKFTPQYGDSFIECVRLEILTQWLLPVANLIFRKTRSSFSPAGGKDYDDWLTKYIIDVSLAIIVARNASPDQQISKSLPKVIHRDIVTTIRKKLQKHAMQSIIELSDLQLACANADPNYGSLWFNCRRVPTDTPRRVIEGAAHEVAERVFQHTHVYLAAMVRRIAILSQSGDRPAAPDEHPTDEMDAEEALREKRVEELLMSSSSLGSILNPLDPTTGLGVLRNTVSGSDFVTAISGLQPHDSITSLTFTERRKALFGTDALFP